MNPIDKSLGSGQRRAALGELKRSSGLAVRELAGRLGLSYMGAKQHCLLLEKKGYVESRNEHRGAGRPHLVYRLSKRGQALFTGEDCRLAISMLQQARGLFGAGAPGKILYSHFQEKASRYLGKMPVAGELGERLLRLAELRDEEGCMSRAEEGGLVEYHCPMKALFDEFPEAAGLEEAMLSKVAGVGLKRRVVGDPGHYEVRFEAFRCGRPAG